MPTTSPACTMHAGLNLGFAARTEIALFGRIVEYTPPTSSSDPYAAVMTVETIFPVAGSLRSSQKLYWQNSTFGYPADVDKNEILFIAAWRPRFDVPRKTATGKIVFDRKITELPYVLQAPCSSPFMFRASSSLTVISILIIWSSELVSLLVIAIGALICWRRARAHTPPV